MLISKENTGKSKYTLEFHSLRAPSWEPPRREDEVENETRTVRHCKKKAAKGKGHQLTLLSQSLFILFRANVLQSASWWRLVLPSMDPIFAHFSSKRCHRVIDDPRWWKAWISFNLCEGEDEYDFQILSFRLAAWSSAWYHCDKYPDTIHLTDLNACNRTLMSHHLTKADKEVTGTRLSLYEVYPRSGWIILNSQARSEKNSNIDQSRLKSAPAREIC